MQRASKAPRVIAGYGGGAATPSPTTQEPPARRRLAAQTQRATGWKPSVQRERPTTAPSAPAQKPVNAEPATPKPAKPTPQRKITALPRGFGRAIGVYNTMEQKASSAKAKAWQNVPGPIRKVSSPAQGVYSGKMGKMYLIQDALFLKDNISRFFGSKEQANELYNFYKDKYASPADAENELKWQAISNIVGIAADNIAQQAVNRSVQSAVRFIASRMLGVALGATPLGLIALAVTVIGFAIVDQIAREKPLLEEQNPAGSFLTSVGGEEKWGVRGSLVAATQPITGFLQDTAMPLVSPALRSLNWSDTTKNSPIEVQALKEERKPITYKTGLDVDQDGNLIGGYEVKIYETYGRRKEEVGMLLDLGYFLTPAVDDKGDAIYTEWVNPQDPNDTIKYREFDLDGIALQEWLEATDWTFGKGGIKERMQGLPPIDPKTAQTLFKEELSGREKNIAINSWYNWVREDARFSADR